MRSRRHRPRCPSISTLRTHRCRSRVSTAHYRRESWPLQLTGRRPAGAETSEQDRVAGDWLWTLNCRALKSCQVGAVPWGRRRAAARRKAKFNENEVSGDVQDSGHLPPLALSTFNVCCPLRHSALAVAALLAIRFDLCWSANNGR